MEVFDRKIPVVDLAWCLMTRDRRVGAGAARRGKEGAIHTTVLEVRARLGFQSLHERQARDGRIRGHVHWPKNC